VHWEANNGKSKSKSKSKSKNKKNEMGGEGLFGPRKEEYKTPRTAPPKSLFEELFPEERAVVNNEVKPTPKQTKQLDKLPTFEWQETAMPQSAVDLREQRQRELEREQAEWGTSVGRRGLSPVMLERMREVEEQERREASVLVLSSASKTLEESDFFRLSPKGQHIEGWTSGIIKSTFGPFSF
jgi:hypothetical protein